MTIVLFTDTFYPEINGVATSTKNLFDLLKANGHEVYVVTTNPKSHKVTFEDNVIRVPGIKLKKLYDYIFAPIYNRKVMKILKGIKADILHINTDFSIAQQAYLYAKKRPGAALVYTYHTMYEDFTYYITKGYADRLSKWIIRQYSITVANKVNEYIVPSYKSLNYLRRIGINSYVNVVPTGVDLTRFLKSNANKEEKEAFLTKYNIPLDAKLMLSLGRIAEEKNIDEVLEDFKYIYDKYNDLYLIIVGDGPYKKKLEEKVDELGISDRTRFIGKVPYEEVTFYYDIADIFVSASISETQGLTYLEAMATNTLVLAKYDSNLTELIKDGLNGFFFDNKEEFSNKIGQILNLNETSYNMMKGEMNSSIKKFSLDTFYSNIMTVYERAKRNNI